MVRFPAGFRIENLEKHHRRGSFRSGKAKVDDWIATKALQHQRKRLSVTRVLVDDDQYLIGFYTIATAQVDVSDLPVQIGKRLPNRGVPVALLAWLGIDISCQGKGHGQRLLTQALCDCHEAGKTFAFVGVVIDCLDDQAKAFYQSFDFEELPGNPYRLLISAKLLAKLVAN